MHAQGLTLDSTSLPYVLTENIQVGKNLQVKPGVMLLGESRSLRVVGDVSAVGTPGAPVVFSEVNFDLVPRAGSPCRVSPDPTEVGA